MKLVGWSSQAIYQLGTIQHQLGVICNYPSSRDSTNKWRQSPPLLHTISSIKITLMVAVQYKIFSKLNVNNKIHSNGFDSKTFSHLRIFLHLPFWCFLFIRNYSSLIFAMQRPTDVFQLSCNGTVLIETFRSVQLVTVPLTYAFQ